MDQKAVRIYQPGGTAYGRKIKSAFAFFDKIFHLSSAAIELYDLIWRYFHGCDRKGIPVSHLAVGLFVFEDHPAGMAPRTGLVQEFPILGSVIDLVESWWLDIRPGPHLRPVHGVLHSLSAGWHSCSFYLQELHTNPVMQSRCHRGGTAGYQGNHR